MGFVCCVSAQECHLAGGMILFGGGGFLLLLLFVVVVILFLQCDSAAEASA